MSSRRRAGAVAYQLKNIERGLRQSRHRPESPQHYLGLPRGPQRTSARSPWARLAVALWLSTHEPSAVRTKPQSIVDSSDGAGYPAEVVYTIGRRQRLQLPGFHPRWATKSACYVAKRRSRSRRGTRGTNVVAGPKTALTLEAVDHRPFLRGRLLAKKPQGIPSGTN